MTDRLPVLYLSEMLASMDKIERYIDGISYEEFIEQEQLVDAVERNIPDFHCSGVNSIGS